MHRSRTARTRCLFFTWLVLLGFALRLWRLDAQDIWWDEARNIDVALRPLSAIPGAPELDIHPPGYFVLLHAWSLPAGATAFAVRFFSAAWGVTLVPLVVALARRLGVREAAPGAALYAALAPFLVGEAQETRMYTLAFALLAWGAGAFWQSAHGRRRAWAWLGISMAAAALVHYATLFVLAAWYGWAAAALLVGWWRGTGREEVVARLRGLVLAGLFAFLLFLPQLGRALRQATPYGNPNLTVPAPGEYVRRLWHAYTVGIAAEGAWALWGAALAAVVVGLGVCLYAVWAPRRRLSPLSFLLAAVVLPVGLYYAVLVGRGTFAPRYISFVTPFLALLVGVALHGWWRAARPLGLVLGGALVATWALGLHADQFNPRFFREETANLAQWLAEVTGPTDLILVDVPYPLGFYYPRYSPDPERPPPDDPRAPAPAYYLFVDINRVADRLTQLAAGAERVFWVQWYKSDTDPRGAVEFLLRKHGVPAGTRAFRGYTVTWYRVAPTTRYTLAEDGVTVSPAAGFGDVVSLVSASVGQAPVPAVSPPPDRPRPVWAVLTWQRGTEPATAPLKASVRLLDPLGRVVAQDDRPLISDRHLTLPSWAEGERATNVYLLELPPGTPPGKYTVTARVYAPADGSPVAPVGPVKVANGGDVVLATVEVARAPAFPAVTPRALADAPIGLVEFALGSAEAAPGEEITADLLWVRGTSAARPPYQVRLSLVAEGGDELIVWEGPPVPWSYPVAAWQPGELVRSRLPWRLPAEVPAGAYTVRLALAEQGEVLGSVELGRLRVRGRARTFEPPPVASPMEPPPRAGELARLLGYTLEGEVAPNASLGVTLVWQALGPADRSYTGFVQLLDGANRVIAQEDHIPLRGEAPTTSWLPGEIIADRYDLTLPAELPAGPYTLIAGWYDATTMRRLPVWAGDSAPAGDHIVLRTFGR